MKNNMENKSIKSRVASLEKFRRKRQTFVYLRQDYDNPDLFHYESGENAEVMTRAEAERRFSGDDYMVIIVCYRKTEPGDDWD